MREIVASAALLCGTLSIFAQPASADNFVRLKNNTLEHVKSYTAPIEVQILNEGPRVRDFREQDSDQTYAINIPPLAAAKASAPILISPDGSSSAWQSGAPGTILINPNRPPASRFGSNIPAGGPLRASLPDGSTTNHLANKNWLHGSMAHPAVAQPASQPALVATHPAHLAQAPATYGSDTISGASGFSERTTIGKVHGSMLKQHQ